MPKFGDYGTASEPLSGSEKFLLKQGLSTVSLTSDYIHKQMLPNAVSLGMVADGVTDNLPLMKTAITRAVALGANGLYVPPGTYNFIGKILTADRVNLPDNFRLVGASRSSVNFLMDATSYSGLTSGQAVGIIIVNDGCVVEGFTYDGQKSLVNGGSQTNYGGNFINRYDNTTNDVVIKDILIKNNPGGTSFESFGIQTGWQSKRWLIQDVWTEDCNGTPISVNGDMIAEFNTPGAGLASDIDIINCRGANNLWHGVTVYGARNVRIINFIGANNGSISATIGNGINIEWSQNVAILGGFCERNVAGGVGGYGWNENIHIGGGIILQNNNRLDSTHMGEIVFKGGAWYAGPGNYGSTPFNGYIQSLYIGDAYVYPPAYGNNRAHLYLTVNPNANWVAGISNSTGNYTNTVGIQAHTVEIAAKDAYNWRIGGGSATATTGLSLFQDAVMPGVRFTNAPTVGPNVLSPMSRWTLAIMTRTELGQTTGAPGGSKQGDAVRLTSGALGSFSSANVVATDSRWLEAGKHYLLKLRYRNVSGDNRWGFCVRPAGWGSGNGMYQYHLHLSTPPNTSNVWYTSSEIIRMPETAIGQPKIIYYGSNTNSILDIEAVALPLSTGVVDSSSQTISGQKITYHHGRPNDSDFDFGDRIITPYGNLYSDLRCTANGSVGNVNSSVGLSITSGNNTGTINTGAPAVATYDGGYRPGMWIFIPGAAANGSFQIKKVRGVINTSTIVLDSAVGATVVNAVCNVVPAIFSPLY